MSNNRISITILVTEEFKQRIAGQAKKSGVSITAFIKFNLTKILDQEEQK